MHLTSSLLLGIAASTAVAASGTNRPPAKNAVLLSSVQTLTLRGGGAKTSHRRVKAVPQLKCVSPRALCDVLPKGGIDVMRCTNQGSSYGDEDIEWSCTAAVPPEFKLGATDVICEGYASSKDPYILKGSCGVEYTVALTELGEKKYPKLAKGSGGGSEWFSDGEGGTDSSAWLFAIIFVGIFAWIAYSACNPSTAASRRQATTTRRSGGSGGGGGGGGGGWGPGGGGGGGGWNPRNDAPPPYPGTDNSGNSGGNNKPSSSGNGQQGWRPGFWTGAAAGAAASSFMRGGQSSNNNNRRNNNSWWGGNDYSSNRPWGGDSYTAAGPSSSSSSRRSGSGSNSGGGSGGHESTGFGSTSRR